MKSSYQSLKGLFFHRTPAGEFITPDVLAWEEKFIVSNGTTPGDRIHAVSMDFSKERNRFWHGTYQTFTASGTLQSHDSGEFGGLSSSAPSNSWNSSLVYNKCLSNLNEKLRGNIDLSVSLAQRGQVSSMIADTLQIVRNVRRHPIESLRDYYRHYVQNSNWRDRSRGLGGKWLEFQYGWKPLAQDVFGTLDQLSRALPKEMTFEARSIEINRIPVDRSSHLDARLRERGEWVDSQRCFIKCAYNMEASASQALAGYTSLNPASIAWEALPFSFVVDWVYDIGGYVRNLETAFTHGGGFKYGFHTITRKVEGATKISGTASSGGIIASADVSCDHRYVFKQRTAFSGPPLPRPPQFHCDLGSGRLLNAAALLSQFFQSGRR